jgi:GT2 family glycosyltransferase
MSGDVSRVGLVVIGRNEGERLRRCLRSLAGQGGRAVYVDSGSSDGSAALARGMGVAVVELDPSRPFTAARGRNAGFAALMEGAAPDHVQFLDGDCELVAGWTAEAAAALDADPSLGIVTGWRTEIEPDRNLFHALAELEWRGPAGDISSCGGDMMVRAGAFRMAGGFDAGIIASEDEEFCLRMAARTGLRVRRLPRAMTRHDIRMNRWGDWWRRALRSGHGFVDLGAFPGHFRRERWRARVFGLVLPLLALAGLAAGRGWLVGLVLLAYAASWLRTARGLRARGQPWGRALGLAGLLLLSKFPQMAGMALHRLRRLRGAGPRIIEYK